MKNSEVIDQPDYYQLPCGRPLEDFIYYKRLNFNMGSAVKYRLRAGHKDGESDEKDMGKCDHYVKFEAKKRGVLWTDVDAEVCGLVVEALEWDGEEGQNDPKNEKSDTQSPLVKPIDMDKVYAGWRYEACLRVLDDLLFLAREREYSGIEALADSVLTEVRNIGILCGIGPYKGNSENKANP